MEKAILKQAAKSKFNSAKNAFKVDNQEGNQCIYMFFYIFNFLIFLTSLGLVAADIFLFVKLGANIFNWIFMIVGIVLLAFTVMAFKLRNSIHLLGFYCVIIFAVFFVMLLVSILFYTSSDDTIKQVLNQQGLDPIKNPVEYQQAYDILTGNVKSVFIAFIFFTFILVSQSIVGLINMQLGAFVSGLCYRNSVQGRTDDLKESLLINARKEEQNEALDEARARNNAKRLEMEKKYPDLAKYNKN